MKKLFLLIGAFTVIAILASSGVLAATLCCADNPDCSNKYFVGGIDACSDLDMHPCTGCVPEFTSLGMGIAIAGAGTGYALIRRKRK